ncbi:MAG: hypothetical protein ACR2NZ_08285 [Rubripirellula sp.]
MRTPATAAGKQAKCPACSAAVPVPSTSTRAPTPVQPVQPVQPVTPQQDMFAGIPSVQPTASAPRSRPMQQQPVNPYPANPYRAPAGGRPAGGGSTASSIVKPPAICLLVLTGLWIGLGMLSMGIEIFGLVFGAGVLQDEARNANASLAAVLIVRIAVYLLFFLVYGLMAYGSYSMMILRNRGLAFTAMILAMIPCLCSPGLILGIPVGIWGLVVLNNPTVAKAFR